MFFVSLLTWCCLTSNVVAYWLPHANVRGPAIRLSLSSDGNTNSELPDFTGKRIYQRTFYRLSPGSKVSKPNALVVEERLRFKPDPNNQGYILPDGPRTYILREGTNEDEITDEVFRFDTGGTTHNGPGTMDTTIATLLYLASNPELIQGKVLEIGCGSGIAGLLGCIGARFTGDYPPLEKPGTVQEEVLNIPNHDESIFPPRLEHLTLSDEDPKSLQVAYDNVRHSRLPPSKVSIKEYPWSIRIPQRRFDSFYRTIIGSDLEFAYPNAKELARTVANSLLPSDPVAIATSEKALSSTTSSFLGLGMDLDNTSTPYSTSSSSDDRRNPASEIDPRIPPTFVHVCPDIREDIPYLRQFLEKGFRMTVETGYLKLQRLDFVYQTLPEDAPESDVEDLDLELKGEKDVVYQSLTAFHHPEYAGYGTGEYFFPLETGQYEGGTRSTYLEPEEGLSPW